MSDLYEIIQDLCIAKGITIGKMCSDLQISRGNLTELKMERIKTLKAGNLTKIANYFNVTVDYLLTGEKKETPAETGEREIKDDDIKIALFGGDSEVTDEMWDEALFAVQLIKERHKREKEKNG